MRMIACWKILIFRNLVLYLEQRETDYRRNFATRRWFSKSDGGFRYIQTSITHNKTEILEKRLAGQNSMEDIKRIEAIF
jgi:hypothetical protein